jgi:hypothetical protein
MNKNKLVLPISILLGCIILGGFYYVSQLNKQNSISTRVSSGYVFAPKAFYAEKESVYVSGTRTGEGENGNNTAAITCSKQKMECLIVDVRGISETSCQLSRLASPLAIPITKWNDYTIIATDKNSYDTYSCFQTTISIDLNSEDVLWVEEPINQSQLSCKDVSDNKIRKWTIENPPFWKNVKDNIKK